VRVIPVIDLKQGQVVRGIAGRREEYRPIESRLCGDARPGSVGAALAAAGFGQVYLADLDAIEAGHRGAAPQPALEVYEELMRIGLDLWVDAGTSDLRLARSLNRLWLGDRQLAGIVAGLESMPDPEFLGELCFAIRPERLIFSLDLKDGVPLLVRGSEWEGLAAEEIAENAIECGVQRIIVLDLARVGVGEGVGTESLVRTLRSLDADLEIIAGGGVRSMHDLESLARAGCDAALVASALHDGRLSAEECAAMR